MLVKHYVVTSIIAILFNIHLIQAAEYTSTSLLFPEATYLHVVDQKPKVTQESDFNPEFTFLHAGKFKSLNILLEMNVDELLHDINIEVERFQLGFDYANTHKFWIGRGHTALGYWNTEYHHGTYLQTSLSRPAATLSSWPRHLSGVSLEGAFSRFDEKIKYNLFTGAGPTLTDEGLEDMDIIEFDEGHRFGIAGRLSYVPDPIDSTEMGVFLGYFEVNSLVPEHDDFDKTVAGAFINWQEEKNRIISEFFYIKSDLSSATIKGDDYYIPWYLQYERKLTHTYTAYGRIEHMFNADDASAVIAHENLTKKAQVIGLRYDFWKNQALTIEASSVEQTNADLDTISIKWNGVFQ